MLFFSLVLFLNICGGIFASETQYPVRIDELGDFIVARPIIETRPEGTELVDPLPNFPRRESMTQIVMYQLKYTPLETIAFIFIEKLRRPRETGETLQFSETELFLVSVLETRINHFNPSILEGVHDPEKIIAFGAPFFRIFKLAYPGLQRVRLSRREIVYLAWLAAGWGMDHVEENDLDTDTFLLKCLKNYYPLCYDVQTIFSQSMMTLYRSGCLIAFEAACQLFAKRIPCRNFLFDAFCPANTVAYVMGYNEEIFFKLVALVRNINDVELARLQDQHVLFQMIKMGLFYPQLMLRPELKDFRISFYEQEYFEDFYSEALYTALRYKNIEAIRFLLNLDPSYYHVPLPAAIANENSQDNADSSIDDDDIADSDSFVDDNVIADSDSDGSEATPYEVYHPRPISAETLAALKAIFLSETLEEILIAVPDIENFTFFNWDINRFITKFQDSFHGLHLLANRENHVSNRKRLFEHSDSFEDSSGHKRHFYRSDSSDSP